MNRAVVYKAGTGLYNWRAVAENGEIVSQSTQGHRDVNDAIRAIHGQFEFWSERVLILIEPEGATKSTAGS